MLKPQTLGNRSEETNLQTQPAAGNKSVREEVNPFGEAEARIPEYADLPFRVFGESLQEHIQKVTLAEDAPPLGIKAHKTNMLIF